MDYIKNPMEIENTSMKIIEGEMGEHNFTKEELSIIKRTIHFYYLEEINEFYTC